MRFPKSELNIEEYQTAIKQLLGEDDCHIFIDTNILSQLFKLNTKARDDFYSWVNSCHERFHIPNWVVMEYSKYVYGKKLGDYIDELNTAKKTSDKLADLQRFLYGYVDDDELVSTDYVNNKQQLHDDFEELCGKYSKIVNAVLSKKSSHIDKVQKEIDEKLKDMIMDTDVYKVIGGLYFDYQLRLDAKVPPGYGDSDKDTNKIGDLIIWNEILDYCKLKNIRKAVFITRDKKDTTYTPAVQTYNDRNAQEQEKQRLAQESMVYEFSLHTRGSEDFCLIDFYTLVKAISGTYQHLAYSFQMVSRDEIQCSEELSDIPLNDRNELSSVITSDVVDIDVKEDKPTEKMGPYSEIALKDKDFADHCQVSELVRIVKRLRSYNWYVQNEVILDLRKLLKKDWDETQENKDAFFVIGRNILQSATGSSFEANRFIDDMPTILRGKPKFVQSAILDGCLYEVFFDGNGMLRQNGFKASYKDELIEKAKRLGLDSPFGFINGALAKADGVFIPLIEDNADHEFSFEFSDKVNELDDYHTKRLSIDGKDVSSFLTSPIENCFATKESLVRELSRRFGVPEKHIKVKGVPDDIGFIRFIKPEDERGDDFLSTLMD